MCLCALSRNENKTFNHLLGEENANHSCRIVLVFFLTLNLVRIKEMRMRLEAQRKVPKSCTEGGVTEGIEKVWGHK